MQRSTRARKTKAERARDEKLNAIYVKREAALKRAESRLTRSFNAWKRAKDQLASIVRTIEKPAEEKTGVTMVDDDLPAVM